MFAELMKMLDVFKAGGASVSDYKGVEPAMSENEAVTHGLFFETAVTAADVHDGEGPDEKH